jgi:autotransporter-associated beta strand protein
MDAVPGKQRSAARAAVSASAVVLAGLLSPGLCAADSLDGADGKDKVVASGPGSNTATRKADAGGNGDAVGGLGEIAGTGGQGGAGLRFEAGAPAVYTNESAGQFLGGKGGEGGSGNAADSSESASGGTGGRGGIGARLTNDGNLVNQGTVKGGAGGSGGAGGLYNGAGGHGGTGGDGVAMTAGGSLVNDNIVKGGTGGNGGAVGGGDSAGNGGAGGRAVVLTAGGSVTNFSTIQGGAGGQGESGGAGGMGIVLTAGGSVTNEHTIQGGHGAEKGVTGHAGDGGAGISLEAGGTVTNSDRILGGNGGEGGGAGGIAMLLTAGGSVINDGTIKGGAGGARGTGAAAGLGGLALRGADIRIVNMGKIVGGQSGDKVQGAAIQFTGGASSLEMQAGAKVVGTVDARMGHNTLILGGAVDHNFDVSMIGDDADKQYQGFAAFHKTGASTWTLTNDTTAVTPWTIKAGTLKIDKDAALGAVSGPLTFDGGTLHATSGFNSARNMALDGGGGTIRIDSGSNPLVLNGTIAGAGSLTKIGTGTLILNGVNTYTGLTTVSAGTLQVGDAATPTARIAGDVLVEVGGTLRGHGTIGSEGSRVVNHGTVRPGGSVGTLTIVGNYTQSPGGTLLFDISPTVASQLKVGGTAVLDGTLSLLYGPGTYTSASYQLINAGSVQGSFATVNTNLPGDASVTVDASGTGIRISLVDSDPSTPVVVTPVNATLFGAVGSAALRESQRVNGVLLDRLAAACNASEQGAGASVGTGGCLRPSHHVWIQAMGIDTRITGNNGAPDAKDRRYGFLAGVDRNFKNGWTLGLAAGYSQADVSEDRTNAKATLDTLRLSGYAGKSLGRVNVAGTVGYGYDFLSTSRAFGTLGSAKGSGHGQSLTAGLQASMPWVLDRVTITPRLGLRYAHLNGYRLNESGPTSQNLGVDAQTLNSLQPYAGVTFDVPLNLSSERPASIQARVAYAYETRSMHRDVAVTAADGTGFIIRGTSESRGLLNAGLGATLPIGKAAKAYVRYDALLHTGNMSAQSVQAGLDYRF